MTKKITETIIVADAGRKKNAEAKDLQSIITKSEWEMRKNDAQCANELPRLYELQREIAYGIGDLGKKASVTNRKSAIENMIVRGESYATGEAPLLNEDKTPEGRSAEEEIVAETKQVANGGVVLSYAEKLALHKQKQAEKKAQES